MTTKIKSGLIADNAIVSAHISSGAISSAHLSSIDTDNVSEGSSNLYFTTARARTSLSVTDSGGDGSLAYDNSTGAITYTGPSASEVRAHLSAGTGVTYSGGAISIGQSVATTASPTFADINVTGNINVTGDLNTVSVADLDVTDQTITLGAGQNEAASGGSGIVVDGSSASLLWDEANDEWDFNKSINVTGIVDADNFKINNAQGTDGQLLTSTGSGVAWEDAPAGGPTFKTFGTSSIMIGDDATGTINNANYNIGLGIDVFANLTTGDNNVAIGFEAGNGLTNQGDNVFIGHQAGKSNQYYQSVLIGSGAGRDLVSWRAVAIGHNAMQENTGYTVGDVAIGYGAMRYKNASFGESIAIGKMTMEGNSNDSSTGNRNICIGSYAMQNYTTAFFNITLGNGAGQGITEGDNNILIGNYAGSTITTGSNNIVIGQYDGNESGLDIRTSSGNIILADADANIRMRIDSSGNVGIGTTSPDNTLMVQGASTDGSGSTGNVALFEGPSGTNGLKIFIDDTENAAGLQTIASDDLLLNPYGGNVGIGTTSPTSALMVSGGATVPGISIKSGGNSGVDPFRVTYVNGTEGDMFIIDDSGNVGIGTENPTAKLHVFKGESGAVGNNTDSSLVLENSSHTYINFLTPASKEAGILWGDSASANTGMITYSHVTDNMTITAADDIILMGNVGIGTSAPGQLLTVATSTNYDPPGLGNSNATFSVLKKDNAAGGNYGIITGISTDGNVWSQVQRTDGTATAYNLYLQPSGGSVGIGIPQNHTYIPNLIYPLRVGKSRTGTGNVTDYLTKIAIDAIGYAGSNYQFGAIDFTGGDTAGASGNHYGRIGCSSMNGANNQETGSLEFYAKAPGFGMTGTTHAMKITGQANTASAGGGTTRNGVLFTYQGLAIDRSWADYPSINVMNSTPYSTSVSTQSELRIHGNNVSSASYPAANGSDFSCTVRADGGYVTGSDRRRKRNITTIDNALDTVKQLTGKRFQTVNRVEEVQEHVSKNGYKLGFIAQEVEDIIPEAVQYHAAEDDGTENWNSSYAMDYGSVVALLVNAIKEQDTTIQDLKSRIETLEG
ncbi:tail fiber domain-containing protein [Gammaproteobacteria bacterium]|nr:tail fiber domain-containing protein [Gammaproteobacteria bacterium]